MSHWKPSGLALFAAAICLLDQATGPARAQYVQYATEWSNGDTLGLGRQGSLAYAINDAGQVVGQSALGSGVTEWSGGKTIDLVGLGRAFDINDAGQVLGFARSNGAAAIWDDGQVTSLGFFDPTSFNNNGQVVGIRVAGNVEYAVEWSGGNIIDLGGVPGFTNEASDINDAGQVVGVSYLPSGYTYATEWSGGSIIDLGGLPGSIGSVAASINDAGQVVGVSYFNDGRRVATEWSGGNIIDLGGLPGSTNSTATAINDVGQIAGYSFSFCCLFDATEWSGGIVINLGGLPGSIASVANGINDAGQVVGYSVAPGGPEPATWVMMLFGFAGLAFAGYRRAKAGHAALARPCRLGR